MAPQILKESPTGPLPRLGTRDPLAEAESTRTLLAQRTATFSASVRSLFTAQEERAELAEQQRRHLAALNAAGKFAFAAALACMLLVMRGVVLGLTEQFGGRTWLAWLAAGLLVVAAFVLAFLAATVVLARRRERESRRPAQAAPGARRRVAVTRHTLF